MVVKKTYKQYVSDIKFKHIEGEGDQCLTENIHKNETWGSKTHFYGILNLRGVVRVPNTGKANLKTVCGERQLS